MAKLSNQPYKGTRDYYPEDMRLQKHIFSVWRTVCERFGYEEYQTPTLEPLALYAAKTGQEIVNEQTYQFIDRGGRTVAIRPEMTPSVARMVAARQQQLSYPARWFSIANFMRYERPQKGREREFWQLNLDIFGVDGVAADAEIITVCNAVMRQFGATDEMYTVRINNRRLINFMMAEYLQLDGPDAQAMIKLFDKKDKINGEQFMSQVADIFDDDRAEEGLKRVQRLVSANSMADLPEEIRDSEAVEEVRDLFTHLSEAGLKNAKFDITLMRGFDYYTGMVFEVFDNHPDNRRAMFGGGRYDGLVGLFGGDNVPTVGAAPGATMTEEFLRTHDLVPDFNSTTTVTVISIGDNAKAVHQLATKLRSAGVNTAVDLTNRKTDKQIKSVVKAKVPYMIFVGEHEVAEQKYRLKTVASQQEEAHNIGELIKKLTK